MANTPVRAAVIQAAPVVFDVEKTLQKIADLAADAARQGARIALFPEAFVCAYPKAPAVFGRGFHGISVRARPNTGTSIICVSLSTRCASGTATIPDGLSMNGRGSLMTGVVSHPLRELVVAIAGVARTCFEVPGYRVSSDSRIVSGARF